MKDINATVLVDLSGSEQEILQRLKKDVRWGINKAIKSGLIVNESEDFEGAYNVLNQVLTEGANKANHETFKRDNKILFVCKKDDKIIGMATLGIRNERPSLNFNASLKEYIPLCPNHLLYWCCIKWAKSRGYSKFDLGGWQINARGHLKNINEFKERWGDLFFWEKDYPFHIAIGRKLIRNSGFFWWFNKVLRGRK